MSDKLTGFRHLHKDVIVSDPQTYECFRVPEGQRWYIESVSIFNDTTDDTECLFGIESGSTFYPIKQWLNLTVDVWETKFIRIWIFPGERIFYKWVGVSVADVIQMSGVGQIRYD